MTGGLALLLPEGCLAVGIVATLAADCVLPAGGKRAGGTIAIATCAIALAAAVLGGHGELPAMVAIDGVALLARIGILMAAALLLMAGMAEQRHDDGHPAWAALVMSLALGGMLTAGASGMVPLYLGLELMSIAGYALAGWTGRDRASAEAGMKYVLFGGAASGLMLFGMSHLYGLTGRMDFIGIGAALGAIDQAPAVAALLLAAVGLAYKLALVPFHFYAPDVYQGAPALGVAALGTVPKLAAAAALAHGIAACIPGGTIPPTAVGWTLAAAAVISLLVASFTALAGRDAKRIVAFSSIGHAGAAILALACLPAPSALAAAAFYLAAYAVATIGALVCLSVLEREHGGTSLPALAGAMRQRPWLTAALCLFLFSLTGIPPLAGFLAKWGVAREALSVGLSDPARAHLAWAAIIMLASTAVSAWAYLLVVRAAVLEPAPTRPPRPRLEAGTAAVLLACAAATVALGLWPDGFGTLLRHLR